jgi:hypothetical protein
MKKSFLNLFTIISLVSIYQLSYGQAPSLGTASGFAVFSSVGALHNDGVTTIYGDYGTNAGANTGDSLTILGNTHIANSTSLQASIDLDSAYARVVRLTCDSTLGTPLGNNTVLRGGLVYCMTTAVALENTLYLDAKNDPTAIFIIKIDGALSTNTNSSVVLLNGASACNVYWQVNGAVNFGINSEFKGTVLANGAISFLKDAMLDGRALTKAGKIDLNNNLVVGCDANGAPLPIVLTSFSAIPMGVNVQLNWTTATEINNDYFTVEHSKNGSIFEEVAKVKGAGNSSIILNYSVMDLKSYFGTSFYRLKQTDHDGNYSYSDIISTMSGRDFTFSVFPNPFQQTLNIYLDDVLLLNETQLVVFDITGKEFIRIPLKQSSTQIDTLSLEPGIYIYHILNNSQIIQSGRLVSQQ